MKTWVSLGIVRYEKWVNFEHLYLLNVLVTFWPLLPWQICMFCSNEKGCGQKSDWNPMEQSFVNKGLWCREPICDQGPESLRNNMSCSNQRKNRLATRLLHNHRTNHRVKGIVHPNPNGYPWLHCTTMVLLLTIQALCKEGHTLWHCWILI